MIDSMVGTVKSDSTPQEKFKPLKNIPDPMSKFLPGVNLHRFNKHRLLGIFNIYTHVQRQNRGLGVVCSDSA
jgi:hypothetical protein